MKCSPYLLHPVKWSLVPILAASMLVPPILLEAQLRGGSHRPAQQRPARQAPARRATPQRPAQRPATTSAPAINNNRTRNTDPGNRNIHSGNRNINAGNKVNIDNSHNRNNININVDRSVHINRNTMVRRNVAVPYVRPPYVWGGRRYYAYHPYFYHPYRPFYWGPVWHPWGFFLTTLAVTAIVVSVENQKYHYDQGVFYSQGNGGYTVVTAPVGAVVPSIPSNAQTVVVNETINNYYYGGTYYEKDGEKYKVVAPTAGTIVTSLPEGGEEVTVGDQKYVKFGETYYQPIQKDGKDVYEVVSVEEEKK